jgi:hypothetical protein
VPACSHRGHRSSRTVRAANADLIVRSFVSKFSVAPCAKFLGCRRRIRHALIREQAAQDEQIAGHGEQIAVLEALVAELREQLDAARRAASRNSGKLLDAPEQR